MTREELELKAKEFDSKLKRHPMSSEELQKVLCDFVEALPQHDVVCEFHCERFDFGRDKKCEQQCSDCHWMQTKLHQPDVVGRSEQLPQMHGLIECECGKVYDVDIENHCPYCGN